MTPDIVYQKKIFQYQNTWISVGGLTISVIFLTGGVSFIISRQPGTLVFGLICLAASFGMVCLLVYGLVWRSKFSISENGFTWTLWGIDWRTIQWKNIDLIKESITWNGLGADGGGNFRNKINTSISRRFIIKTVEKKFRILPILFSDGMDNFYEWRHTVSQYVDEFGIKVDGSLGDRDDEGLQ